MVTLDDYPPAFGIDLQVDDSDGVRMQGELHGFSVVVVRQDDRDWTKKVLASAVGSARKRRLFPRT
jgi:hypothetical protein